MGDSEEMGLWSPWSEQSLSQTMNSSGVRIWEVQSQGMGLLSPQCEQCQHLDLGRGFWKVEKAQCGASSCWGCQGLQGNRAGLALVGKAGMGVRGCEIKGSHCCGAPLAECQSQLTILNEAQGRQGCPSQGAAELRELWMCTEPNKMQGWQGKESRNSAKPRGKTSAESCSRAKLPGKFICEDQVSPECVPRLSNDSH